MFYQVESVTGYGNFLMLFEQFYLLIDAKLECLTQFLLVENEEGIKTDIKVNWLIR